jgi:hypothetical protein
VPLLWEQLSRQHEHWTFVADPDQEGKGIGVLRHDPAAPISLITA